MYDDGTISPRFENQAGTWAYEYVSKLKKLETINYTQDWYMDNPKTEEEFRMLMEVFDKFGVKVYNDTHKPEYPCIAPDGAELTRWPPGVVIGEKVDLLGALMKLTRPVVTEQQKKINQLKQTIESLETQAREAKQQIEQLEKESK